MNSLKISLVGLPEVPQIKFLPTNDIERNIKGNPIWVSLHKGHPEKRLHSQPTPRTRAPNSWHFSKQTIHFGDSLLFLILFFFFFVPATLKQKIKHNRKFLKQTVMKQLYFPTTADRARTPGLPQLSQREVLLFSLNSIRCIFFI